MKEVFVTPEALQARKEHAIGAKCSTAIACLPELRAQLAAQEQIVAAYLNQHGLLLFQAPSLRESLFKKQVQFREKQSRISWGPQAIGYAKQNIQKIIDGDRWKREFWKALFSSYTPSPEAQQKIAVHEAAIRETQELIQKGIPESEIPTPDEERFLAAFDAAASLRQSILQHQAAVKKFDRLQEKKQKEQEALQEKAAKQQRQEAIVAAFLEKARDLADNVRKKLRAQLRDSPHCPYCGGEYGDEPHADHIYPLSKGGFSTAENMVLVCASCNLKKSDLTIREFVLAHTMDRALIEENLERLRKVF